MKLKDRVALVTGGGSGIGRATALLFAEEGAKVVVNDLHLAAAEKTVQEMGAAGAHALALAADVSDSGQVRAMFAEIDRRYGTLEVLVNNAGIAYAPGEDLEARRQQSDARIMEMVSGEGIQTHWTVTQEMTDEAWHRVIGVHLNGTFFCTREALKLMSRRNRGAIVNLSSVAALMGLETVPHYSAAKGGILAFTRAVAREVGLARDTRERHLPRLHRHAHDPDRLAARAQSGTVPHSARPARRAAGGGGHRPLPRLRRRLVLHRSVAVAERRPLYRVKAGVRPGQCRWLAGGLEVEDGDARHREGRAQRGGHRHPLPQVERAQGDGEHGRRRR